MKKGFLLAPVAPLNREDSSDSEGVIVKSPEEIGTQAHSVSVGQLQQPKPTRPVCAAAEQAAEAAELAAQAKAALIESLPVRRSSFYVLL